jgi:predicted dehydrogenase
MKTIGVGVIGASPLSPGWAAVAHIPAIQALPDFALRAVSTSRQESAAAAAKAFNQLASGRNTDDGEENVANNNVVQELLLATILGLLSSVFGTNIQDY